MRESVDRALHDQRMAVRDVDDEHVGAGAHDLGRPLEIVAGGAHRRRHAQPAAVVARRKRMAPMLDQILGGDEAEHRAVGD